MIQEGKGSKKLLHFKVKTSNLHADKLSVSFLNQLNCSESVILNKIKFAFFIFVAMTIVNVMAFAKETSQNSPNVIEATYNASHKEGRISKTVSNSVTFDSKTFSESAQTKPGEEPVIKIEGPNAGAMVRNGSVEWLSKENPSETWLFDICSKNSGPLVRSICRHQAGNQYEKVDSRILNVVDWPSTSNKNGLYISPVRILQNSEGNGNGGGNSGGPRGNPPMSTCTVADPQNAFRLTVQNLGESSLPFAAQLSDFTWNASGRFEYSHTDPIEMRSANGEILATVRNLSVYFDTTDNPNVNSDGCEIFYTYRIETVPNNSEFATVSVEASPMTMGEGDYKARTYTMQGFYENANDGDNFVTKQLMGYPDGHSAITSFKASYGDSTYDVGGGLAYQYCNSNGCNGTTWSNNPNPPNFYDIYGGEVNRFWIESNYLLTDAGTSIEKFTITPINTISVCPGDLNGDRVVNADDLSILQSSFGNDGGADINADGITDIRDLTLLLSHYGESCGA